jgi:hypothetical protein
MGTVNEADKKITVTVYGTTVTGLVPAITIDTGASIDPASGIAQDFTNPVSYLVTAEDGSTATYTVTVTVIFTGTSGIEDYLDTVSGGDIANPIPLAVSINLTDSPGGWADILEAIAAANKYVELDLSACTMSGTEFNPGAADTGERYIVSLVLPNVAESIAAGTSSSYPTFRYFTDLTEVSGTGITGIGNYAFENCTALTKVSLPEAAIIGNSVFRGCNALASADLPKATAIGTLAFNGCKALASVNFPATPPTLGSAVFQNTYDSGSPTAVLTIHVPSGAVSAYTSSVAPGWGVIQDTEADWNTGKYGVGHKAITITDVP